MNKLNLLAVVAGLTVAFTTISAEAAIVRGRHAPQGHETESDCGLVVGHVRSVHRADINAINGQPVMLIHVCDQDISDRNSYGSLFVNGNVNTLRAPIARNETLISALAAEHLDQFDVVSLRFGGNDSIVLYVHDRDMN
jgi:hypothetical protein